MISRFCGVYLFCYSHTLNQFISTLNLFQRRVSGFIFCNFFQIGCNGSGVLIIVTSFLSYTHFNLIGFCQPVCHFRCGFTGENHSSILDCNICLDCRNSFYFCCNSVHFPQGVLNKRQLNPNSQFKGLILTVEHEMAGEPANLMKNLEAKRTFERGNRTGTMTSRLESIRFLPKVTDSYVLINNR